MYIIFHQIRLEVLIYLVTSKVWIDVINYEALWSYLADEKMFTVQPCPRTPPLDEVLSWFRWVWEQCCVIHANVTRNRGASLTRTRIIDFVLRPKCIQTQAEYYYELVKGRSYVWTMFQEVRSKWWTCYSMLILLSAVLRKKLLVKNTALP